MIRFTAGFLFAVWVFYAGWVFFALGALTGAGLVWLATRRRAPSLAATLPEHELRRRIASAL